MSFRKQTAFHKPEPPSLDELRALFFSPADMPALLRAHVERMKDARGVIWDIPCFDKVFNPGKGGDTLGLLGRPSNGKSTLLQYLERVEALRLIAQGRAWPTGKEVVVHITYEQTVEAADAKFIANRIFPTTDILRGKLTDEQLFNAMASREGLPIWPMGESVVGRRKHARMTVENIFAALRVMEAEFGCKPTLIGLDYLQLVPSDGSQEGKTAEVGLAMNDSKELGRALGAMMAIALQAGRAADKRSEGLPEKEDNQHSSAIEQALDMELSLYRAVTNRKGKTVSWTDSHGNEIMDAPVTEEMLLTRIVKNRDGPTGDTFMLHCEPQNMILGEMDMTPYLAAKPSSATGGLSF